MQARRGRRVKIAHDLVRHRIDDAQGRRRRGSLKCYFNVTNFTSNFLPNLVILPCLTLNYELGPITFFKTFWRHP
jgi:hypothetical protein